jgi:1-acyl-sn-glycerol-3-phosphate acyltransferase
VAVFPEGTTSDGTSLLPFHANLLQAAVSTQTPVQAVALRFADAAQAFSPAAAYVGDTSLVQSLWWVVTAQGLQANVSWLTPQASAQTERRGLAERVREQILQALNVTESPPRA